MNGFTECGQLDNLADHIYRAVTDNGLKTVIIDYLQLVEGDSRRNARQFEVVREATTRLHGISKKLDIPIIALVQLKQVFAKENRDSDRPPAIDDLGDSSAIGRAASTVAVLAKDNKVAKFWEDNPPYDLGYADFNHRYAGDNPFGDKCAIIAKTIRPVWYYVIKNQQGKVGKVPMLMYPSYFMFRPGLIVRQILRVFDILCAVTISGSSRMAREKTLKEMLNEPWDFEGVHSPFYRPDVEERIARANREHPLTREELLRLGWKKPRRERQQEAT